MRSFAKIFFIVGFFCLGTNGAFAAVNNGLASVDYVKDAIDARVKATGSNGVNATDTGAEIAVSGVDATSSAKGVAKFPSRTDDGKVVTGLSATAGEVTVTTREVQIPATSQASVTPISNHAVIWVE